MANERIEVSERFRRSLQTRIKKLQEDAAADERIIPLLFCEDHQRRQMMLVQTQLEDAFRLTDLLSSTRYRSEAVHKSTAKAPSQTAEGV